MKLYPATDTESCDTCSAREGRHYCRIHSQQVKNMDIVRCDDWTDTPPASQPPDDGLLSQAEIVERLRNTHTFYAHSQLGQRAAALIETQAKEIAELKVDFRRVRTERDMFMQRSINLDQQLAASTARADGLQRDKELVDELERRGVDKIYFHDRSEINPASQCLRATMEKEIAALTASKQAQDTKDTP